LTAAFETIQWINVVREMAQFFVVPAVNAKKLGAGKLVPIHTHKLE